MALFSRKVNNLLFTSCRRISKLKQRTRLQDVDSLKEESYKQRSNNNLKVYVWGLAETGALGNDKSLKKHKKTNCLFVQHPTRLPFAENHKILDVSCGYGFSVFVVKSYHGISLFGSGINTDSQIGYHKHSGVTNKPIEILIYPGPIELPLVSDNEELQAKKAATGRAHTVVLSENGAVFTLGNNAYGQCARPIIENEKYFGSQLIHRISAEVFNNEQIADIACGQDHTMFITNTGRVFTCGWSADGQTGLGHYNNAYIPTLLKGDIQNEKIIKVASAADCVLALSDKGEVFGWGNSEYGQISEDHETQQVNVPISLNYLRGLGKIIDVTAGGSFCAVLNEAGDVFVWGYGLLGLGPAADYVEKPTQIPPTLFGRNSFNPENRVISIRAGISHIGAINTDNDLFMWGRNKFGCLGLGHEKDQYFPYKALVGAKVEKISCGVDHTVALCKSFTQ